MSTLVAIPLPDGRWIGLTASERLLNSDAQRHQCFRACVNYLVSQAP